jgi:spore coat polysaccharide biosynthesis protein SpsF
LQTVLLHNWRHYRAWDGVAWRRLLELCEQGKIAHLGASVYEPGEALTALQEPNLRHLQIPMNLLDWRWKAEQVDRALASRPDVLVHARSALLQGLLVTEEKVWPEAGGFDAAACARRIRDAVKHFRRKSVADLCLAYVRSQDWITSVVVGCETMEQLEEDLILFRLPKLTAEEAGELERLVPRAPDTLLNPSRWRIPHDQSTISRN